MNATRTLSLPRLVVSLLLLGLAAACAPTPLAAPTLNPAPTHAPTQKPKPTTAPTQKPASTLPPTKVPATASPTLVVPIKFGTAGSIGDVTVLPSNFQIVTASGSDKPKAGNVYLVITVTVQNSSKTKAISYDPATLVVLDTVTGKNITAASLKSLKNGLPTQTLKAAAKITGDIAYEVPQKDSAKLQLVFKAAGNQSVSWVIGK